MCERYHTYSRDCQKLFSEHLLACHCGDNDLERRVKNELASSRSTPTRNVMGARYHRVQTAALNTFREHHSKSFPTRKSAAMNTCRKRHSKSFPTIKDVSPSAHSIRPWKKENATSCWEGNEVSKARNFSFCSNSLKELFVAMKLEGAIVQTAFGPDGSFRVGSKVGTNGSFRVSSRKHTDLTVLSAQEKEMWVLRLVCMFSSAAYFSSRPTIKVVKSVLTVLMVLLTAIETFLFPKSDIEALNDKRNSRVQRTTNIQEDDFEVWYDFEESLSLFFYYLLHFTFFVISLPACYYLHFL